MTISDRISSALTDHKSLLEKRLSEIEETETFALSIVTRLEDLGVSFGDRVICVSTESGGFGVPLVGNIPGRWARLEFYGGDTFTCDRDDENQKGTQEHEFIDNEEYKLSEHPGRLCPTDTRHEFLDFDRDENRDRTWHSVKWTQAFKQVTCEITAPSKEDLIEQILLSIRDFLIAKQDAVAA